LEKRCCSGEDRRELGIQDGWIMLYLTLAVLAIPLLAMLWAIVSIVRDRARLRKYHFLSLLGGFLMFPIGITYLGVVEIGTDWLTTLPGVVFGTILCIGLAVFARAELLRHRNRPLPKWACPDCGYDRRGLEGRCPECGALEPPQ